MDWFHESIELEESMLLFLREIFNERKRVYLLRGNVLLNDESRMDTSSTTDEVKNFLFQISTRVVLVQILCKIRI